MTEQQTYKTLVRKLKPFYFNMRRIETGALSIGIPDILFYSYKNGVFSGFIEQKQVRTLKTDILRIPWRPKQLETAIDLNQSGMTVFLVVGDDRKNISIFPGSILQDTYFKKDTPWEVYPLYRMKGDWLFDFLYNQRK